MKLVIDSNQLQTPRLREFLAHSPANAAVLPDFAALEAYKGDPLKTIFKSMTVLADFPAQVVVLKGSAKNFAMSGRRKGLQRRLIDETQTRRFPEYIRAIRLAEAGDRRLRKEIMNLGEAANEHLEKMRGEATKCPRAGASIKCSKTCPCYFLGSSMRKFPPRRLCDDEASHATNVG